MRIPIKATAREPSNRPDTYQRLPTARPHLRKAAGPNIWGILTHTQRRQPSAAERRKRTPWTRFHIRLQATSRWTISFVSDLAKRLIAVLPVTACHVAAEGCSAAALDGAHHLELVEAQVATVGIAPCGPWPRKISATSRLGRATQAGYVGAAAIPFGRAASVGLARSDFENDVGGHLGVARGGVELGVLPHVDGFSADSGRERSTDSSCTHETGFSRSAIAAACEYPGPIIGL